METCRYNQPKYPVFIDLVDKPVVVIGAGAVAARKVTTLLEYGARIRVVAPEAQGELVTFAKEGLIAWEQRTFIPGDLAGAFLVICAVGDADVNNLVYAEASGNNQLINVVDVPSLCNFIVPSIVKRGPLQIAISTSGAAPTVAKQLRRELEETYPEDWAGYVSLLGEVRSLVIENVPGEEACRKPLFEALAKAGLLERLRAGEKLHAPDVYREIVAPLLQDGAAR